MAIKFDAKKEVTRSLKFKPNADLDNLCLGTLQGVEVVITESPKIKEDGSENPYEYAGLELPNLKFTFKNHIRPEDKDKAERFFIHVEKPIVSKTNKGETMTEKTILDLYEQMWDRIKHIHDAYSTSPNYVPFGDLGELNEKAAPDVRIKQLTKFFTVVAAAFNDGKAGKIFQDEKGNGIITWMKLVADYSSAKFLVFPTWPGEGFIEKYTPGVPPTIELKPSESQVLKANKKDAESNASGDDNIGIPANIKAMMDNIK
jgi:hypothetical protein